PARPPRLLRRRSAPGGHVRAGLVAAAHPRRRARAEHVRELPPRVAARLIRARNRVELPHQLAGRRVVRADEAFLVLAIRRAGVEALNDFALRDDRSAARAELALRTIADRRFPHLLSGPRIEREQVRS